MAQKQTKKLGRIPLLIGLIIITAVTGIIVKLVLDAQPVQRQTTASTQSVAAEGEEVILEVNGDPIGNCVFSTDNEKRQNKDKEFTCKSVACRSKSYSETLTTYKNNDVVNRTSNVIECPTSTDICKGTRAQWPTFATNVQCIKYTAAGADASCPGGTIDYPTYSLCLSNPTNVANALDKTINYVKLTVKEVPVQDNYYYCLKTDPKDCDDDDIKNNAAPAKDGKIVIDRLCGDGPNKLKQKNDCDNDGSDWFHQEKTYRITFYEKPKVSSAQIAQVSMYIAHMYPEVIKPTANGGSDFSYDALNARKSMDVVLEGRTKTPGENANSQNSYWVRLIGVDNDYKSAEGCVNIRFGNEQGSTSLQLSDYIDPTSGNIIAKIGPGNYFLQIKEAKDYNPSNKSCKEGKFTYINMPIRVGQGSTPGVVGAPIKDPNRKEVGLQLPQVSPQPVCDFQDIDTATGYCKKIKTALGIKISTEPMAFVADLFSIVLMIGGIAAVVFIIQAGYTVLTSAGNKEKVAYAREQITSAIMGLIFIILSVAILEFIGVDLLHIPGLGR